MTTQFRIVISVVIMTLVCTPALLGQTGQPPRPAPGRTSGPVFGMNSPSMQGGFGARVLTARPLENKPIDEKEQKKHASLIAAMEKRSGAGRSGASANRAAELAATFRLGSTHLRYGQEQEAKAALDKAWQLVAELYRESKTATAATGQVRSHLRELQLLTPRDPELVLSLMSEMAPAHQQAFEAITQEKAKGQLAQPLAQTWSQLMQMGQLDKDTLKKASFWVLQYPQALLADRPIPPAARADYESQLTQVNVNITGKLRELAERQLGRRVQPLNAGAADTIDAATAQVISLLDAKRGPISRFIEADVHFRFGQFRTGLQATTDAWRQLMEFYRANPGAAIPVDTAVHFETLQHISGLNPLQGLMIIDQLDPMYRGMLQVDRRFGAGLADLWLPLIELPLQPPTLARAGFWLTHVSTQHKEKEGQYAAALADIQRRLEEAGEKGGQEGATADKKDEGTGARDKDDGGEQKNVGGRRGVNVPREIDSLKREPR